MVKRSWNLMISTRISEIVSILHDLSKKSEKCKSVWLINAASETKLELNASLLITEMANIRLKLTELYLLKWLQMAHRHIY